MPQSLKVDFPFTAEQVVTMGRTPYGGGLFPMLLRQGWSAYRRSREFAADVFAASAGHGPALVEALGTWQVLDVATPWWLRLSHPYVEQRIDRLQRLPVE